MSTTMRVTEPLSFAMALRERESKQLASLRTEAARSGKCALISAALGCGAGCEPGAKNLLAALARGGGAFGGEASLEAAATFVAEVLGAEFLFPFLFCLAASISRAGSSRLLVPPTVAAYDCVVTLEGCPGAPLLGGPEGGRTAAGWGREGSAGVVPLLVQGGVPPYVTGDVGLTVSG